MYPAEMTALIEAYLEAARMHLAATRAYKAHIERAEGIPTLKPQYEDWEEYLQDQAAVGRFDREERCLSDASQKAYIAEDRAEQELMEHLPAAIWFRYENIAFGKTPYEEPCIILEDWREDLPGFDNSSMGTLETEERLLDGLA